MVIALLLFACAQRVVSAGCRKAGGGTIQRIPKVANTWKHCGIDRSDPRHIGAKKIMRSPRFVPPSRDAWPVGNPKIKAEDLVDHGVSTGSPPLTLDQWTAAENDDCDEEADCGR